MAVTRAWHSSSSVWAVARWPPKTQSLEMRGAVTRSCSAVPRSIAWRSGSVMATASADTRARANPSSTSCRETFPTSACWAGVRVLQMGTRCPRWGGGPAMPRGKARGSGAAGRSPGVRPVLEPVLALRSGEGVGEKSNRGRGAV